MELPEEPEDDEPAPDADEPELLSPPPLRWSVLSTCAALFLAGAFCFLLAVEEVVVSSALALVVLGAAELVVLLGAVELDELGEVAEPLVPL